MYTTRKSDVRSGDGRIPYTIAYRLAVVGTNEFMFNDESILPYLDVCGVALRTSNIADRARSK